MPFIKIDFGHQSNLLNLIGPIKQFEHIPSPLHVKPEASEKESPNNLACKPSTGTPLDELSSVMTVHFRQMRITMRILRGRTILSRRKKDTLLLEQNSQEIGTFLGLESVEPGNSMNLLLPICKLGSTSVLYTMQTKYNASYIIIGSHELDHHVNRCVIDSKDQSMS